MSRDLYQNENGEDNVCWRIYDPVRKAYCCSGRHAAGNGRSVWFGRNAAVLAMTYMPREIRGRLLIKKFKLVEVTDG